MTSLLTHVRRQGVAYLALFFALGGTAYAAQAGDPPSRASTPARAFAFVEVDGATVTVDPARSRGVGGATFRKFLRGDEPVAGIVCISGLRFTPRNMVITSEASGPSGIAGVRLAPDENVPGTCGPGAQALVTTQVVSSTGATRLGDRSFFVLIN